MEIYGWNWSGITPYLETNLPMSSVTRCEIGKQQLSNTGRDNIKISIKVHNMTEDVVGAKVNEIGNNVLSRKPNNLSPT